MYKHNFNNDITCIFFSNKIELQQHIYRMIQDQEFENVVFKGDVCDENLDVSYKIIQKIIPYSLYSNCKGRRSKDKNNNLKVVFSNELKKININKYVIITETQRRVGRKCKILSNIKDCN